MNDSERLIRLEERYAHLQTHVAAQDKAMLELNDEVAQLRQELAALRVRLHPAPQAEEPSGEDRPPHY